MKYSNTYVETRFDVATFKKDTDNKYRVVSQRPYLDTSGKAGIKGTSVTLMILEDHADHGNNKETGLPNDSNVFETFDVTILNGQTSLPVKKGDLIALGDYDAEHSYIIDAFNLILRFKSYSKIEDKKEVKQS